MYKILYSNQAQKDAKKIKASHLEKQCQKLLDLIAVDPFIKHPPYEKLIGDLRVFYSRRINIQHRLVYCVDEPLKIVKVLRLWPHYA